MTEPDWTTAPLWARWFTVDVDGGGWWWKTKPKPRKKSGRWLGPDTREWYYAQPAGVYPESANDWKNSLRQRPTEGGEHDRA